MAGRFDISLLGDKALERSLAQLTEKVERNILVKAFRSAGKIVLNDAKRRAPTRAVAIAPGTSKRRATQLRRRARAFARLANSLSLRPLRRRKGRVGYAVWSGTRQQLGIGENDRYYYPAAVEYGHAAPHRRRRLEQAGIKGTHLRRLLQITEFGGRRTPPHPFLRPALRQNEAAILAQLASELRNGIAREARV